MRRHRPHYATLLLALALTALLAHPPLLVESQTLPPPSAQQANQSVPDCTRDARGRLNDPRFRTYCIATRDGHVFWASSSAPIATNLPPPAREEVSYFMQHMHRVVERAKKKRNADYLLPHCDSPQPNSLSSPSHYRWLTASSTFAASLRLPFLKSHCFTAVTNPEATARTTIRHLRNLNDNVNFSAQQLANRARTSPRKTPLDLALLKWDKVVGYFSGFFDDSVYKCTVYNVVGLRVRGVWGIAVKLTNADLHRSLAEGKRSYLSEILTMSPGAGVTAVPVTAFRRGFPLRNDTTSTDTLAHWGGRPEVTEFFPMPVSEVPALSRILTQGKKDKDLVQDTVFGSNIAILVLPIFMTLVPISSIDYVTAPVVLLYALMTDIFSTLPLFVKGIELLTFFDRVGCDSWVHGIEARDPDSTVVIETWCASCLPKTAFRRYGYAFVALSIFFMLLGVGAEIYARQRLLNSLKKKDMLPQRFWSWSERKKGYPNQHSYAPSCTTSETTCTECSCLYENSFSLSEVPCGDRVSNFEDVAESNSFLPLGSRRLNFFAKADG